MSETKQNGLNGVFGAANGTGIGSLTAGRHVERRGKERKGSFSALGRLGGSLRPSLGDGEDGEEVPALGSIAAEAVKYGATAGPAGPPSSAPLQRATPGGSPATAPAGGASSPAAGDATAASEGYVAYSGGDDGDGGGSDDDGDEPEANGVDEDAAAAHGAAPPLPLGRASTAGVSEPETALVTVLPQESLERVRFSADRTDGQFVHLYAALERHLQDLYDAAAIEAASDPDVTLPTVFGITSAVAGEGKTSVAMHLALMVARNTFKRVCLIDMSLGDDDISRRLGAHAEVEKGVMDVLEGHDYMIRTIQVEECGDLSIMPAGRAPVNPVRAARSPAVPEVIAAARQMFDLVVVDMPPVTSGNALPIAAHLDRVMMVVNAGVTPRGLVNEAVEQIGRQRVLGVVLNKIKRASPSWVQRRFGYF